MGNYETEIEYYLVKYGADHEREFKNENEAVEFARKKYNSGYLVSVKQIRHLVDWI